MSRVIYACDVGSVRTGTFAWARVVPGGAYPTASVDINDLIIHLSQDVERGMSIALGFEALLFMPVPNDSANLSSGRDGDGNRSMFAPAGAAVATLAIHEAAWILRAIHAQAARRLTYTLDWLEWPPQEDVRRLLLWEAFVSGETHSTSHERDAATAAVFFREHESQRSQRQRLCNK